MKYSLMAALVCLAAAPAAHAVDYNSAMKTYLESNILSWSSDRAIIDAIAAQNTRTAGMTAEEIETLDLKWRAEIGAGSTPTITPVLTGPLSDMLRSHVAKSGGVITEVFVMDAQGLNVAASDLTSDYWQGDEAKHQQTYGVGAGAVHYGEVEFDESSQQYQAQISITLSDPATGAPVGAMTVGVNADSLM